MKYGIAMFQVSFDGRVSVPTLIYAISTLIAGVVAWVRMDDRVKLQQKWIEDHASCHRRMIEATNEMLVMAAKMEESIKGFDRRLTLVEER